MRLSRWFSAAAAAMAVLLLTAAPTVAEPAYRANGQLAPGTAVALRGTPHLWFADGAGVLHWGGDTRALAGRPIDWDRRVEVTLELLLTMCRGEPWLSTGLVKIGDPIYLAKWEANETAPTLLHVKSIVDVELFGISASNYGSFVIERDAWERRFGFSTAQLPKGELAAATSGSARTATSTPQSCPPPAQSTAVPTPAPPAVPEPGRYTNQQHGFSLVFPPDWNVAEGRGLIAVIALAPPRTVSANVTVEPGARGATSDEVAENALRIVSATFSEHEFLSSMSASLGGLPARRIQYRQTVGAIRVTVVQYIVVRGDNAFALTLGDETSTFDEHLPMLEQIAASWRFDGATQPLV